MQDGWGENEASMAASRHSSWEEEEEGGGMWNNAGSQGSGSSWGQSSNGGWGQGQVGKKPNSKVGAIGEMTLILLGLDCMSRQIVFCSHA